MRIKQFLIICSIIIFSAFAVISGEEATAGDIRLRAPSSDACIDYNDVCYVDNNMDTRQRSKVIEKAYIKGAIFVGHSERFDWQIWQDAMDQESFNYKEVLDAKTSNYPWSFIK